MLQTFAALLEYRLPENKYDGVSILPLFLDASQKKCRETFAYYRRNDLEALRFNEWKLHFSKTGQGVNELYNLNNDISESVNVYEYNPEIVKNICDLADEIRYRLGDERTGIAGCEVRPCGLVDSPKPLTEYDPDHPYIIAIYDKAEAG